MILIGTDVHELNGEMQNACLLWGGARRDSFKSKGHGLIPDGDIAQLAGAILSLLRDTNLRLRVLGTLSYSREASAGVRPQMISKGSPA